MNMCHKLDIPKETLNSTIKSLGKPLCFSPHLWFGDNYMSVPYNVVMKDNWNNHAKCFKFLFYLFIMIMPHLAWNNGAPSKMAYNKIKRAGIWGWGGGGRRKWMPEWSLPGPRTGQCTKGGGESTCTRGTERWDGAHKRERERGGGRRQSSFPQGEVRTERNWWMVYATPRTISIKDSSTKIGALLKK